MTNRHDAQAHNELLATLSPSEFSQLRQQLKQVPLDQGDVLYDPGERTQYVYFPLAGMISLLSVMRDGKAVEIAAVGREGALGVHCGIGMLHSNSRAVVEIPGSSYRIPVGLFQKFVRDSERMRDVMSRYSELRLAQTQQWAACNALRGAEARLSRSLLHTSDIIRSDVVPVTQEFLSQMLGVRRTTVTGWRGSCCKPASSVTRVAGSRFAIASNCGNLPASVMKLYSGCLPSLCARSDKSASNKNGGEMIAAVF